MRIRASTPDDLDAIAAVINDAAQAYRGVIPPDRWHEPYMPRDELASEIASGVAFWVAEEEGRLLGVMGIQGLGGPRAGGATRVSAAVLRAHAGRIRPFEPRDLEPTMDVWSRACEASHPFLDRGFMRHAKRFLRDSLPSGTLVYEETGIKGFIRVSASSLDAIFVDPAHQRRGIGTQLLDRALQDADELTLAVFVENPGAILFYHRHGFYVIQRRLYPPAGRDVLVMRWERP